VTFQVLLVACFHSLRKGEGKLGKSATESGRWRERAPSPVETGALRARPWFKGRKIQLRRPARFELKPHQAPSPSRARLPIAHASPEEGNEVTAGRASLHHPSHCLRDITVHHDSCREPNTESAKSSAMRVERNAADERRTNLRVERELLRKQISMTLRCRELPTHPQEGNPTAPWSDVLSVAKRTPQDEITTESLVNQACLGRMLSLHCLPLLLVTSENLPTPIADGNVLDREMQNGGLRPACHEAVHSVGAD
jgi:hypothetical protein